MLPHLTACLCKVSYKGVLMRKSTIFISAVLTTFALVMLYGVVSAYRGASTNVAEAAAPPTATFVPEATDVPATATPTPSVVTPVQAAQLAAQVLGNHDLLSAESSTFSGVAAYMITFTNKDVVYVGLDGQILSVQIAPVVVNAVAAPVHHKNNKGSGGSESNSTQSSQETHQENGESGD